MEYLEQGIDSFIFSSLTDEFSEWVDTTTYIREFDAENLTDASTVRYGNYYFRSITDDNLNNNPEETLGVHWVRWDVSNKYAMIDLRATTASTSIGGSNVVLNSTFDTATDWSFGAGWYYGTGVIYNNGFTPVGPAFQDVGLVENIRYEYSIELSAVTSGSVYVAYHDGTDYVQVSELLDSVGVYTGSFSVNDTALTNVYIMPVSTGFIGEVTEFTLNDSGDLVVTFAKDIIDTLAIGYYSAETLKIELLDASGDTVWYVEETQSPNEDVEDYYTYIYSLYSLDVDRTKVFKLPIGLGVNLRVTLSVEPTTNIASCGYLIGDAAVDMGETLYGVGFSFESYSSKTTDTFGITTITKRGIQDLVDFETVIDAVAMSSIKRKIKTIYGEVLAFVVDPTEDSKYDNIVTLGTVDNVSVALDNPVQSIIAWSIQEII